MGPSVPPLLPRLPAAAAPSLTSALLARDPRVVYGAEARAAVRGGRVLVTGAGGSIGSEIARQADALGARELYLLDHDESALHALQLELRGHGLFDDDSVVLCDIRDEHAVREAMTTCRPDIVFHAAAHKHLPLLERYPAEAVKTNILGTLNVLRAAAAEQVTCFVNISTDKAAQPTSVLGVTKRIAELLVAAHAGTDLRVASVRFGNVLGSRGSFLSSLCAQVTNGRPITVTHRDVTRYFMTIPEAAGLVIEAAVLARLGETFVLDMGAPVRILDLVERYLAFTGEPSPGMVFTGLRPGEKVHETLVDSAEVLRPTRHRKITASTQQPALARATLARIPELRTALSHDTATELRGRLAALIADGLGRASTSAAQLAAV
jgi:FlaA1/EpsC-like NDP-sugar epimerase